MPIKTDLRVTKSRKALHEAMMTLLKKKEFNKIQIKELTDEAMVSRQTFYLHYQDKEALFKSCVELIFSEINKDIESYMDIEKEYSVEDQVWNMIEIFKHHGVGLRTLLLVNSSSLFVDAMRQPVISILKTISLDKTIHNKSDVQKKLYVDFIIGGFYMIMIYLLENKEGKTTEEMMHDVVFIFKMHVPS